MTQSGTNQNKLDRKPQPDIYCPVCLGYGVKGVKGYKDMIRGGPLTVICENCGGSGWINKRGRDEK